MIPISWYIIGIVSLFVFLLWIFTPIHQESPINKTMINIEEIKLPNSTASSGNNYALSHSEDSKNSNSANSVGIVERPIKHSVAPDVTSGTQTDFLSDVLKFIQRDSDIVYLNRFYDEHNLSFALTERYFQSTVDRESFVINSLSFNSTNVVANYAQPVNALAWSRTWYRQMYLVKKSGHPGNFRELAVQINKIRHFANETNFPIAAIRYHTYSSYCKLMLALGNPSQLPIPVMLTFKLNPVSGHLTEDVPYKTCIKRRGYKRDTNSCPYPIIIPAYLRRCKKTMHDLMTFINHAKILLLVTNQNVGFSSEKVLVLPLGVRPAIATEALKFIEMKKQKLKSGTFSRPVLFALSNSFTGYQDQVSLIVITVTVIVTVIHMMFAFNGPQ